MSALHRGARHSHGTRRSVDKDRLVSVNSAASDRNSSTMDDETSDDGISRGTSAATGQRVCKNCGYATSMHAWTSELQTETNSMERRQSIAHRIASTGLIQTERERSELSLNFRAAKHVVPFAIFCCACGITLSFLELPNERRTTKLHKSNSVKLREMIETAVREGRLDPSALQLVDDTCKLDLTPYDEVDLKWRFPGASFFVTTVVTTIGYGSYAPATDLGKAFTCVIAIGGISWFGFILALLSERLEAAIIAIWWYMRNCLGHAPDPDDQPLPSTILFYSFMANVFYLLFTAFIGWVSGVLSLGNSLYMAIITFTTVGLGDYSPPFFDPGRPLWYRSVAYMGSGILALLGLALLATFLSGLEFWASWRLVLISKKTVEKSEKVAKLTKSVTKKLGAKRNAVKFDSTRMDSTRMDSTKISCVVPGDSQVESAVEETSFDSVVDRTNTGSTSGQPQAQGQPSRGNSGSSSSAPQ